MHRIAATIVTYHSPIEDVVRAVDSFFATSLDVALSIVDNASGSDYLEKLKAVVDARATIIEAPRNGGFGYGHNIGMLKAPECEFYLILNPDVRIHPGCLEALIAYLQANPDVAVVGPKVLYEDGVLQPLNKRAPTVYDLLIRRFLPSFLAEKPFFKRRMEHYMMLDTGYEAPCEVEFLSGCFLLFRKSVLDRIGGFDERFFMYLEDADITKRARELGRTMYCPDGVITHRWARGSHKKLSLMWVMLHSMVTYFSKWGVKWW
ncbi:MAG: glycosyltransferase family 2 protein [Rickettsiales bacterium]